jgi:hypothetical protein
MKNYDWHCVLYWTQQGIIARITGDRETALNVKNSLNFIFGPFGSNNP